MARFADGKIKEGEESLERCYTQFDPRLSGTSNNRPNYKRANVVRVIVQGPDGTTRHILSLLRRADFFFPWRAAGVD